MLHVAKVVLKHKNHVLFDGDAIDITPLGFNCELIPEESEKFCGKGGKYINFDIELLLTSYSGERWVSAQGMVYVIRRISQEKCCMTLRFVKLEPYACRMIAEHISSPVTDINTFRESKNVVNRN